MAFGAAHGDVVLLVLREGLSMAGAGIVAGTLAAFALSGVLANLLYEVPPTDVVSYGGAAALLLTLTAAACYVPARRASRTDPLVALRQE